MELTGTCVGICGAFESYLRFREERRERRMQKRVAKQGNSQMIAGVLTRRTVSVDAFDQTLENSSRATLTKTSETFNIASSISTNLGNWNRPRSR